MPQNASCLETEVVWKKDLTSEGAVFTIETSVLGSRKTPAGGGHGLARLLLGEWACSPRRLWVARTGSPPCFAQVNCSSLGRTERCGDGRSATRSRAETHFILLEKLPCFLYHTDLLQFTNATNVRVFQSHLHNKSSNAKRTKRNDMITEGNCSHIHRLQFNANTPKDDTEPWRFDDFQSQSGILQRKVTLKELLWWGAGPVVGKSVESKLELRRGHGPATPHMLAWSYINRWSRTILHKINVNCAKFWCSLVKLSQDYRITPRGFSLSFICVSLPTAQPSPSPHTVKFKVRMLYSL